MAGSLSISLALIIEFLMLYLFPEPIHILMLISTHMHIDLLQYYFFTQFSPVLSCYVKRELREGCVCWNCHHRSGSHLMLHS